MDWSKTKTKLIILLLVLNAILLVNHQFNSPSLLSEEPSKKTVEDLNSRLESSGIDFELDLPKITEDLRPLIVKYSEQTTAQVNDIYFGGKGKVEITDNLNRIVSGQEEITIINNRRFLYENYETNQEESKEEDRNIAIKFLKDKNYDTKDMVLVKTEKWDDMVTFEFAKIYNDIILETSYTRITVENKMVTTLDRLWIEVIEEEPRSLKIEPSYKALYSLLERELRPEGKIIAMEICYYFNPEEQGLLEDNTKAERGRALPAWRITFQDGTNIIVDNY